MAGGRGSEDGGGREAAREPEAESEAQGESGTIAKAKETAQWAAAVLATKRLAAEPDPIAAVGKQWSDKVAQWVGVALKMNKLAGELHDTAHYWRVWRHGKHLLGAAESLTGLAASTMSLVQKVDELSEHHKVFHRVDGEALTEQLERAKKWVQTISFCVDVLDNDAGHRFIATPSPENAAAWAEGVAMTLKSASNLVPADIPVVSQMWKGLLDAPINYVTGFNALLKGYLGRIDRVADIHDEARYEEGGEQWAGPLSLTYRAAPDGLRNFMKANRNAAGVDLQSIPAEEGFAALMNMIDKAMRAGDAAEQGAQLDGITVTPGFSDQAGDWLTFLHRAMRAASKRQSEDSDPSV
jgi:hypothetical protein